MFFQTLKKNNAFTLFGDLMISKKTSIIIVVLCMLFFLVSCGEKVAETGVVAEQPVLGDEGAGVVETVVVETGDTGVVVDTENVDVTVGDSGVSVSVGDEEESTEEAAEDEAEIVAVAMRNYKFDDQEITVKEGTTVVWTNYDSAPHTVDGEGLDSGTISSGESWTYTFTTKGLYDYYCSYHPSMTGTVIVE